MRLKAVKLAGFKSFVDPTTVHLRAPLAAVVGPNGCGKSNIVDAVRWVLGESSARQLRGGELADVIFNGSGGRAPAGRASVELLFDNTDGRIAGAYARYAEVSVRRELERDGESHYSLNGSRCRRRDVLDLFLGTGLGPRSYSIIEQGMIARLVEARPDELRAHLEEVAGISRYRERRRETEARIADTRENLARLDDVRGEIAGRLSTLERQVKAAQRFRELRERERELRAQHLALRLHAVRSEAAAREQALAAAASSAARAQAGATAQDAALEAAQATARQALQTVAEAQQAYYAAGAEVARAEENIAQAQARARRAQEQAEQARTRLQQLTAQIEGTAARHAELRAGSEGAQDELRDARAALAQAEAAQRGAEQTLEAARQREEHAGRRRGELSQALRAARARTEDLQARVQRIQERAERLAQEADELASDDWSARREQLDAELSRRRAARSEAEAALEAAEDEDGAARAAVAEAEQALGRLRARAAELRGRIEAERAVQHAALDGDVPLPDELAQAPTLAAGLRVEGSWRAAVEAVLGPWLGARVVDDLDAAARAAQDSRGLALIDAGAAAAAPAPEGLGAQARAAADLEPLLGSVLGVADLEAALARRHELPAHASLVTPQGHRVTRSGVLMPPADGALGVLDRAEFLAGLEVEQAHVERAFVEADQALARVREREQRAAAALAAARRLARSTRDEEAELAAEQARAQAHGERVAGRRAALTQEREELHGALAADREQLEQAQAQMREAQTGLAALDREEPPLAEARRVADEALRDARDQVETARRGLAALEAAHSARSAELRTLADSEAAWRAQLEDAREQLAALEAEHAAAEPTDDERQAALQAALAARAAAEAALGVARREQERADHALAQATQARTQAERGWREADQEVAQARAVLGESQARAEALLEQFAEQQLDAEAALATLPEDASEPATRGLLEDVERALARLGAVNLAAPDEHRELSERAGYLAAQHDDLTQALATLEQSMARMDRETRARFKETFAQVNAGFGQLFPRLFGGGEARLELLEEDPLDAGVALVARPPGKRNASVHALSGGEKALTAIALVFALFELNPAPLCILDEVDAPLDEHNIGRFGELVREMSTRVQLVLITHNRATMEFAGELVGVTMAEAGVSRLVAVDLEQAAAFAEAGA